MDSKSRLLVIDHDIILNRAIMTSPSGLLVATGPNSFLNITTMFIIVIVNMTAIVNEDENKGIKNDVPQQKTMSTIRGILEAPKSQPYFTIMAERN